MAGPYLSPLGPQADLLTEYMFGRRRQVSVRYFRSFFISSVRFVVENTPAFIGNNISEKIILLYTFFIVLFRRDAIELPSRPSSFKSSSLSSKRLIILTYFFARKLP